ncbi:helix-turn-helix transcriptional regulator [Sporolactobacillus sp. Y61]|uniref:Helix-turn-helix transcriptional regulator n=1 Tax=Sporolactobacillus sp. Y61 TaxID=3160863 RepID=A0AAU8IC55_9BACL|nr:helix-turn-helix transcriptional regulator [Sporolactobacillus sp. THM19-2]RYL93521.1 XRE family transcriptional regulator [Sporolactobacillus sp. THM19-2]
MLTVDLKKLRERRKRCMTLEQMSEKLGYQSPNGYFYLESGRSKITAEMLAKVATILEIPIQELFTESTDYPKK